MSVGSSGGTAGSRGGGGGGGKGGANSNIGGNSNINSNSSVYDKSSAAYDQALGLTGQAASMYASGSPAMAGDAATYDPSMVNAPQTIMSGISGYMNPYTQDVIDASMSDIQRQTDLQQMTNAATASKSGAFGGSRHGVVEALTNSEGQRNMANTAAQLRSQGFNTAAGLAGQDINNIMNSEQFNAASANTAGQFNAGAENAWNAAKGQDWLARAAGIAGTGGQMSSLAGQGFNFGQNIDQQQMVQGTLQQQLAQSIMDKSSGQYQDFASQPQSILNMALQSLGMNPLNQENTTSGQYTPGWFDYLSLGAQVAGA